MDRTQKIRIIGNKGEPLPFMHLFVYIAKLQMNYNKKLDSLTMTLGDEELFTVERNKDDKRRTRSL